MNLYLFFFSIYALLITPITVRGSLRLGKKSGYRVRIQAAGLPFMRKRDDDDQHGERPIHEQDVAQSIASADIALLRTALSRRVRLRAARMFQWEELSIRARFAFEDACLTALCYASVRTLLQTLVTAGLTPRVFKGSVRAFFDGQGSEILVHGILSARLGSLGLAVILFGAVFVRARHSQARSKEEQYAATSH